MEIDRGPSGDWLDYSPSLLVLFSSQDTGFSEHVTNCGSFGSQLGAVLEKRRKVRNRVT